MGTLCLMHNSPYRHTWRKTYILPKLERPIALVPFLVQCLFFSSSVWLLVCAGSLRLSEPISSACTSSQPGRPEGVTCTSSRPGGPGGVTIVASCNYKIVKMHVSIEKLFFLTSHSSGSPGKMFVQSKTSDPSNYLK